MSPAFVSFLTTLACISLGSQLFADTVEKKDGQVVEGEIKGNLVLGGDVQKSKGNSKVEYTVSYNLIAGKKIDKIDTDGVHGMIFGLVVASKEEEAPDDAAVFRASQEQGGETHLGSGNVILDISSKNGMLVFARFDPLEEHEKDSEQDSFIMKMTTGILGKRGEAILNNAFNQRRLLLEKYKTETKKAKPNSIWKGKLLGELRHEKGDFVLIPALEISTKEGVIKIPLDEIVE